MCLSTPQRALSAQTRTGTNAAAVVPCDIAAYVVDKDPAGLNVRSGPGSTFNVVGNLPNRKVDGGIGVHITGSSGDWFRIDEAFEEGGEEERVFFKGLWPGLRAAARVRRSGAGRTSTRRCLRGAASWPACRATAAASSCVAAAGAGLTSSI